MNLAKNILIKAIYFRVSIQQQRGDHKKAKRGKKLTKKTASSHLRAFLRHEYQY
jgi:hypothetical protein